MKNTFILAIEMNSSQDNKLQWDVLANINSIWKRQKYAYVFQRQYKPEI